MSFGDPIWLDVSIHSGPEGPERHGERIAYERARKVSIHSGPEGPERRLRHGCGMHGHNCFNPLRPRGTGETCQGSG